MAATVDPGLFARRPDGPNVVLVMIDTLRADYVGAYGGRARTPAIDALARDSLRFTRFYPEAMATVPARRSVMTGRRVFPFRNWHVYRGLMTLARLGAHRRRARYLDQRAAPLWLVDGLRDRQPVHRLLGLLPAIPQQLQPLPWNRGSAGPDGSSVVGVP